MASLPYACSVLGSTDDLKRIPLPDRALPYIGDEEKAWLPGDRPLDECSHVLYHDRARETNNQPRIDPRATRLCGEGQLARYQASEREARYRKAREYGLSPVITEGDSWFSYELYLNLIDRIDDTHRFALKRLESSGDTVANMVGASKGAAPIRALKKVVQAERPVFLFFSGGGNDIVGSELRGALLAYDPNLEPEDYLATAQWRSMLATILTSYEILIDEIGPLCPIFAHGYDYFYPSNRPVKIFPGVPGPGPWVFPEMVRLGINDPKLQHAIARVMIDQFNDSVLTPLAVTKAGFFAHVDLRNTLAGLDDWQNEIHPTRQSFQALAERFLATVSQLLPGVRKARAERLGGTVA